MRRTPAVPTTSELLEHAAFARNLARGLVRDTARAEDVVQDVWHSALEKPPRHGVNLRAFVATLVRRTAERSRRAESRLAAREEDVARGNHASSNVSRVSRGEMHRKLIESVLELAEPYRSAILERFFDGETRRAGTETARTRVRRGLALLRERLEREVPGGREAWLAAILPIADLRDASAGAAAASTTAIGMGVIAMGWKMKLAAVAGVVVAGALGWGGLTASEPMRLQAASAPDPLPVAETPTRAQLETLSASRTTSRETATSEILRGARVAVPVLATRPSPSAPVRDCRVEIQVLLPGSLPAAQAFVELRLRPRFGLDDEVDPIVRRADSEGRVEIDLERGMLEVLAWTEDYLTEREEFALELPLEVEILLEPAGAVEGFVFDAWTGEPIAGAAVWGGALRENLHATTAADGHYRLAPFPATGVGYTIQVRAQGYAEEQINVRIDPDGSWSHASVGWQDSQLIDGLRFGEGVDHPGGQHAMDGDVLPALVSLPLIPELTISGRVVDADGEPVRGALARAQGYYWFMPGAGSPDEADTRTDDHGRFECSGLRTDISHALAIEAPGHAQLLVELEAPFTAVQDPGELVLEPGVSFVGRVVSSSGRPAQGIEVEIKRRRDAASDPPPALRTGRGRDAGFRSFGWMKVLTDHEGRFRHGGLTVGEYALHLEIHDRVIWKGELAVGVGEREVRRELMLPESIRALEGEVTEGPRGLPGARVEMRHDECDHEVVADANGRFRFWGVEEDEQYYLEAQWKDPEGDDILRAHGRLIGGDGRVSLSAERHADGEDEP